MNTPFNFLGIPETDPKEAQVIVMPLPFEKTTSYGQALELIKAVVQRKHLVGADFVELSPIKKMPAYDFLVAKLVYKLIGYKFA